MIPTTPVRDWERRTYNFLAAPVPPEIREAGGHVVRDVLAAAVAGSAAEQHVTVLRDASFADGDASVLGTDRQVDPAAAAMCNVAAAITQEIEEGHDRGGHVGASIVAGAVGVAETENVDGATFVNACVRSYELCARLEYAIFAIKGRLNDAVPWLIRDPHSTWTTVGPALTAALCVGADEDAIRETFRVAANLAVVSMHDPYAEGAPARNFTAGFSAQAGVTAATLAAAGLRGSAAAVGAVYDPFTDLLDEGEFDALFESLGEEWWILDRYHKPYPSCRYTHAPLDALRDADCSDLLPVDVSRIDVFTYRNGVDMAHAHPDTLTAAKFSTPYVLARWITDGEISLDAFGSDHLGEESVWSLAERVHLHEDEAYERAFPESWGARVEVTTVSGETLTGSRAYPRGDRRDPLSPDELRTRNRTLLVHGLNADRADDALAALTAIVDTSIADTVAQLRIQ